MKNAIKIVIILIVLLIIGGISLAIALQEKIPTEKDELKLLKQILFL